MKHTLHFVPDVSFVPVGRDYSMVQRLKSFVGCLGYDEQATPVLFALGSKHARKAGTRGSTAGRRGFSRCKQEGEADNSLPSDTQVWCQWLMSGIKLGGGVRPHILPLSTQTHPFINRANTMYKTYTYTSRAKYIHMANMLKTLHLHLCSDIHILYLGCCRCPPVPLSKVVTLSLS